MEIICWEGQNIQRLKLLHICVWHIHDIYVVSPVLLHRTPNTSTTAIHKCSLMQDFKCWGKKVLSMEKGKGKWQKMCGREEAEVEDEVWGKNAGKSIEVEIHLVGKDKDSIWLPVLQDEGNISTWKLYVHIYLYNINHIMQICYIKILIFMRSSTCFEPEGTSSGRELYIQVR